MRRSPRRWQFKVCLMGDGYVGKTSIRRKYLGEGFKRNYLPTLGVDFAQKPLEVDGKPTNLVIWDIAGQTVFQNLRKRYYEGSSGMILVYSVVDRTSFDNASKWLVEAHDFVDDLPPLIVVGNKIDLRPGYPPDEVVSTEEGQEFAKRFGEKLNTPVKFIESSALTGENIEKVFSGLTRLMFDEVERTRPGFADRVQEQLHEPTVSPASGTPQMSRASSETSVTTPTASSDIVTSASTAPLPARRVEIDPITSLPPDSDHLKEDEIGVEMSKLMTLRAELKVAEEDLAKIISDIETSLLNLKNSVHVKKIMYEHLRQQLTTTRQEWAEAYEEYVETEKRRKEEITKRSGQIEDIRKDIENVGRVIRTKVSDLEMKKMAE